MNYPYNNYYNPYQGNVYQQMPQMMNPVCSSGLQGKIVNTFDEITANDVSMNQPTVFVRSDMSEIEVRKWANNGLIERVLYSRVDNVTPNDTKCLEVAKFDVEKAFNEVNLRLDNIDKYLERKNLNERKANSNPNVK